MTRLTDWIRRHQVVAFFVITFAISWGLAFSWGAVLQREQFLLLPVAFVAVCGPGLAGIIVSAVTNTRAREGPRRAFWIALLGAWVASALVFLVHHAFIEGVTLSPALIGLIAVAVVPVAFVIASAYSRIPSVRRYLSSLVRPRGVWGWSLLALVLPPASILLSLPVGNVLGRPPIPAQRFPDMNLALIGLFAVKFLYQLFFFNATGEETGWRGFALPRLQARTSPLVAALIIAVFWTSWHAFFWQAEGQPVSTPGYWVEMAVGHTLLSVLIVWICNRAQGSILVAGIAHAATNAAQAFVPMRNLYDLCLVWAVVALVLILVDRMWKKLPPDHPAVYGV